MAASAAGISFGTTLTWDSETIAELTKVGAVNTTIDTTEITSHDSDDGYREYLPTVLDGGTFDIEGWFLPSDTAGQVAMFTDFYAKSKKTWTITFPTAFGSTWTGSGYLTAISTGDCNVDNAVSFKATIKITGKPTIGITASTGGTFIVTGNNGAAAITPASAAGTYEYQVTLASGATSYTVTPTVSTSTITLLDATGATQTIVTTFASTSLAAPIDGMHTIYLKCTESGKAVKTYTIHVGEAA